MKAWLFALLVVVSATVQAASPTETYLATKRNAVAALSHPPGTPERVDADRIEDEAVRELGRLIRDVVGDIGVRGFPSAGESNIVSLADGYMESGRVDGVRAISADGVSVLVTTVPLVQGWLDHYGVGLGVAGQPSLAGVEPLLGDQRFYTQAFFNDSAVYIYAEIPVAAKLEGAFVRAFLIGRSQDGIAPFPPAGLIVSVVRGARITLFDKKLDRSRLEIPVCKADWDSAHVGIAAMFDASRRAPNPPAAVARAQAAADRAEGIFLKCYGERLLTEPAYQELATQAQELAGRVRLTPAR